MVYYAYAVDAGDCHIERRGRYGHAQVGWSEGVAASIPASHEPFGGLYDNPHSIPHCHQLLLNDGDVSYGGNGGRGEGGGKWAGQEACEGRGPSGSLRMDL